MLQSHINQSFIKYKSGNKERYLSFLFEIVHHWCYIIYLCSHYFILDEIYAKNTTCNFKIVSMKREFWIFNEFSPLLSWTYYLSWVNRKKGDIHTFLSHIMDLAMNQIKQPCDKSNQNNKTPNKSQSRNTRILVVYSQVWSEASRKSPTSPGLKFHFSSFLFTDGKASAQPVLTNYFYVLWIRTKIL